MATTPPRVPPRFVPTLTEVVREPIPAQPSPPAVAQSGASGLVSSRVTPSGTPAQPASPPPVRPMQPASSSVPRPAVAQASPVPARAPNRSAAFPAVAPRASNTQVRALPEGAEEYMVHRVMQRVDVVLDKRLREAIATVVQEQTRSVLPRLREEIESVVRQAVYEAVADELASTDTDPSQP